MYEEHTIVRFQNFVRDVSDLFQAYKRSNPNYLQIALHEMVRNVVHVLRDRNQGFENVKQESGEWYRLEEIGSYPLLLNERLQTILFPVSDEEIINPREAWTTIIRSVYGAKLLSTIAKVVSGVSIDLGKHSPLVSLPQAVSQLDARAPKPTQFAFVFDYDLKTDGDSVQKVEGVVMVTFVPLISVGEGSRGVYPVLVTMGIKDSDPSKWPSHQMSQFWQQISTTVETMVPKENLDFLSATKGAGTKWTQDASAGFDRPLFLKPGKFEVVSSFASFLDASFKMGIAVFGRFDVPLSVARSVQPLRLSPGTRWSQITLEFLDGHTVRITAPGVAADKDYREMGFEDTRKHMPNVQWQLLREIAENGGEMAWSDSGARQEIKKRKHLLSRTLKCVFQLEEDPFFSYRQVKAYKIKAKLIPD